MDNLTVVIPFFNGHETIGRLLSTIPREIPVVVVDDVSDTPLSLEEGDNLRIIRTEEKGYFSGAVNAGCAACSTDVLVLNQDTELRGSAAFDMLAEKRSNFAMIGEMVSRHPAWPQGYIQGTFMFLRRDALAEIGGMNAKDFPLWGATAEWQCRAARKGFQVLPLAEVPGFIHHRPRGENFGSSIKTMLERKPDLQGWFLRTPPLISVVMPCYNYGRYLREAIASMIGGETCLGRMPGQSFQGFEIIIVDDASTDETQEIIEDIVDPLKGIHAIRHEKRQGTPGANNSGMKMARGHAVTHLSADDMMEPWRLDLLFHEWEKTPGMVIYDDAQTFANGRRGDILKLPEYDFDQLIWKNQMHAGIVFAKSAWAKCGGYPSEMIHGREDWAMNVRLGLAGYCGRHIPQAGYLYRRENQGRSIRNTTPDWRERFLAQMQSLFPLAYTEKRPMACCGGRKNQPRFSSSMTQAEASASLPGADGLVLLEYTGRSYGTQTWKGPVSGQRYTFGLSRPTGYVARKDLATGNQTTPGLLEIRENGRPIFRKITIAAGAIPPPALAEAVNQGMIEDAPQDFQASAEDVSGILELSAGEAVGKIKAGGFTPDELLGLRMKEETGRKRKTVLAAIDGLLYA